MDSHYHGLMTNNYYHTDSASTLAWLASVIERAQRDNLSVRFSVDFENRLRVKVGGSMWSAPIESTHDVFRDGAPVGNFTMTIEDSPMSIADIQRVACTDEFCHICGRVTDHWGEHDDEQILNWAKTPKGQMLLNN